MVRVSVTRGQVERLFATPVVTDDVPFSARLNDALEPVILARRKTTSGHQLSNRGGWQSEHDLLSWGGEAARAIADHALLLANSHTAGRSSDSPSWRYDAWANVSENGHFNMPHFHGASFWAAVYYVTGGDDEGGELVLHDPRLPGMAMHTGQLGFKNIGAQGEFRIQPRPGLMVLFPAWLFHRVEVFRGASPRISIAMNIRAKAPAEAQSINERVN